MTVQRHHSLSMGTLLLATLLMVDSSFGDAEPLESGEFAWSVSDPILAVDQDQFPASPEPWVAVKDPSIVRFGDQWHLFCTVRRKREGDGRIHIAYMSFTDWPEARNAKWSVLKLTMGYHGAPQIFFFQPHKKWYLIYQAEDSTRGLKYGPCFSTNDEITNPTGWTLPEPLYVVPEGTKAGLDFWIICDDTKAHLFFTTLNGKMWRADTALADFPNRNWSAPSVVLKDDIFEASHMYKLKGKDKYLTFIEAQRGRTSRYFKAYLADTLDGSWRPLSNSYEQPFVSPTNVVNQDTSWATSYSHGELIRAGFDQRMEIDSDNLQLLFQGADTREYQKNSYGNIPWRLGLLWQNADE